MSLRLNPAGNVDDEGTLFALAVANITYVRLPHPDAQLGLKNASARIPKSKNMFTRRT